MSKQEITAVFIVATLLTVATYDIFAELVWGPQYTISDVVRGWATTVPLLKPLILSAMLTLFWHLFIR